MNVISRLERLEKLSIAQNSQQRIDTIIVRPIGAENGKPVTREITHAGVTGVGWKIERNHSESEADFEVRAIETAPRNEYGMARIILLSEHSYVLDE